MSGERPNIIQEYYSDMRRELGYEKWQTSLYLVAFVASLVGLIAAIIGGLLTKDVLIPGTYENSGWFEFYRLIGSSLFVCVILLVPCRYWIEKNQKHGAHSIWSIIYVVPWFSFIDAGDPFMLLDGSKYPFMMMLTVAGLGLCYFCLLALKFPRQAIGVQEKNKRAKTSLPISYWILSIVWPICILLLSLPLVFFWAFQLGSDNSYQLQPYLGFALAGSGIFYWTYSSGWDSANWKQHSPYANLKKPQETIDAS